jgi:hypothetical protein
VNLIEPKALGIDPLKIAAIQDNAVATTANLRAISDDLRSVSATLKTLADQLAARLKFDLPPDPS